MRVLWGAVVLLALTACSDGGVKYPAREVPQGTLADLKAQQVGRKLFLKNCAFCHGHLDEGRSLRANDYAPPPMDFSDPRYRQVAPDYLFWRIDKGKTVEPYRSRGSVMPAWGRHFSPEQIWQLVAYIKTRSS